MTRETRQPVECACCGWTGKRMTGQIVMCPKCGQPATFVWVDPRRPDAAMDRGVRGWPRVL